MERFKQILIANYIAPIVIGLVAAQGIIAFLGSLVITLLWPLLSPRDTAGVLGSQGFRWPELVHGAANAVLYFAAAYLLLRWLYFPSGRDERIDEKQEELEA